MKMKKKFYFNLENKKILEQKIWSKVYVKQIKRFYPKKNINIIDNHSEINTIFSLDNKKGFSIFFNNIEMLKINTSKVLFFKTLLPIRSIKKIKSASFLSKRYKLCFENKHTTFFFKEKVKAGYNTYTGGFQAFLPGSQARGVISWSKKRKKKKFKFYLKFYLFLLISKLQTQCNVKAFSYNLKKFLTKIIFFHVAKFISKDKKSSKKGLVLRRRVFRRRKDLFDINKNKKKWWEKMTLKFRKIENKELKELKIKLKKKQKKQLKKLQLKMSKDLITEKNQRKKLKKIKLKMFKKLNNKKILKKELKRRKISKNYNIKKMGWKLKFFEGRKINRAYRKKKKRFWKKRTVQCVSIPYERLVSIKVTPPHKKKNFVKRHYYWHVWSNFVIIHSIELAKQRELIKKRGFTYKK